MTHATDTDIMITAVISISLTNRPRRLKYRPTVAITSSIIIAFVVESPLNCLPHIAVT